MAKKILFILSVFVISGVYTYSMPIFEKNKKNPPLYTFWGEVYYDKNQNGLREAGEVGVGGVLFHISNGKSFKNQADGTFEQKISHKKQLVSFRVDTESLPSGAYLTSPPEHYINKSLGSVRKFSFGIYFEQKEIQLFEEETNKSAPILFEVPKRVEVSVNLKDDGVYFNDRLWLSMVMPEARPSKKESNTFSIKYKSFSLELNEIDVLGLKRFIRINKEKVFGINIVANYSDDSSSDEIVLQKADVLAREVKLTLLRQGIRSEKIKHNTSSEGKSISVEVITADEPPEIPEVNCRFRVRGRQFIPMKKDLAIKIPHEPHHKTIGEIRCGRKSFPFVIPSLVIKGSTLGDNPLGRFVKDGFWILNFKMSTQTNVKLSENTLGSRMSTQLSNLQNEYSLTVESNGISYSYPIKIKEDANWKKDDGSLGKIIVRHGPYLRESRDLDTMFWIKGENLKEFNVNGLNFNEMDKFHPLVFSGKRDKNPLNVEVVNKKNQLIQIPHHYTLAFDPKYSFTLSWALTQYENRTTFQQTKFILDNIQRVTADFQYFLNDRDGIHLELAIDPIPTSLNKIVGGIEEVPHKEYSIHYQRRLFWDYPDYHTPKFTLFAGLRVRSFVTDTPVTVLLPETLWGIDFGIEYMEREAFIRSLDLATQLFFTFGGQFDGSHNVKLVQELRWSLNAIGEMFGETYYSTYDRHKNLQHYKLVTSAFIQNMNTGIHNASRGNFKEFSYGFSLGVNFSY